MFGKMSKKERIKKLEGEVQELWKRITELQNMNYTLLNKTDVVLDDPEGMIPTTYSVNVLVRGLVRYFNLIIREEPYKVYLTKKGMPEKG